MTKLVERNIVITMGTNTPKKNNVEFHVDLLEGAHFSNLEIEEVNNGYKLNAASEDFRAQSLS